MAAFQGGITAAPGQSELTRDLTKMNTKELIERHQVAKNKCAEPIARRSDDGSILDYVPVVAAYNLFKDTSEEDAAANKQFGIDISNRQNWCRIRDKAAAELAKRTEADVAASLDAAHKAALGSKGKASKGKKGPVYTPRKPEVAPTVTDIVLGDIQGGVSNVASGWQKLNPFYWIGQAYDSAVGTASAAVGLADVQTPLNRLVGLLRLLLLLAAGVGLAYALSIAVKAALGFGAQQTKTLVGAAPALAKLAV